MDAVHAMNATHAQEHAGCTKSDSLALHKKSAAALAGGLLVGHVDEHLGSIRATVDA